MHKTFIILNKINMKRKEKKLEKIKYDKLNIKVVLEQ